MNKEQQLQRHMDMVMKSKYRIKLYHQPIRLDTVDWEQRPFNPRNNWFFGRVSD